MAASSGASSTTLGRSQAATPTSTPAAPLAHHRPGASGCARASRASAASSGTAESASGRRKFELKARCGESAATNPPPTPTRQLTSRAATITRVTQAAEVNTFWASCAAKKLRPSTR